MVWGGGASAITHAGPPVTADGSYSAGNLVYDSNNTLWLCVTTGTPGTWVQVSGPNGAAASASFTPANPATTASATQVMMGLGFTGPAVSYKPVNSGIVLVSVSGLTGTNTGLASVLLGARYGAGAPAAAPQAGVAVTGTSFPVADLSMRGSGTGAGGAFALTARLALTPATQYWFDLALQTGNVSDAAFVTNLMFFFQELAA